MLSVPKSTSSRAQRVFPFSRVTHMYMHAGYPSTRESTAPRICHALRFCLVGHKLQLKRLIGDFGTFAVWEVSVINTTTLFALKVYEEDAANFTEVRGKKTSQEIVTWERALARDTPHVPGMYVAVVFRVFSRAQRFSHDDRVCGLDNLNKNMRFPRFLAFVLFWGVYCASTFPFPPYIFSFLYIPSQGHPVSTITYTVLGFSSTRLFQTLRVRGHERVA